MHQGASKPLPTARPRLTPRQQSVFSPVPKLPQPPALPPTTGPPTMGPSTPAPAPAPAPAPSIISSVPRIADPMLPANVVCDASKTTRGARAALATAASYGSIIPSNVMGGTQEVDWAGFTRSLPTHLPTNRNERHLLNAILSIWNTKV